MNLTDPHIKSFDTHTLPDGRPVVAVWVSGAPDPEDPEAAVPEEFYALRVSPGGVVELSPIT